MLDLAMVCGPGLGLGGGCERKSRKNGCDRRTRNALIWESRCRLLCIITDFIDGNAFASICTKCCCPERNKQHFVHNPQSQNHFLMEQIQRNLQMEWTRTIVQKRFTLYSCLLLQQQFSAWKSQDRTERMKVASWASLGRFELQQRCKRIVRIRFRSWKLVRRRKKSVRTYFRREN